MLQHPSATRDIQRLLLAVIICLFMTPAFADVTVRYYNPQHGLGVNIGGHQGQTRIYVNQPYNYYYGNKYKYNKDYRYKKYYDKGKRHYYRKKTYPSYSYKRYNHGSYKNYNQYPSHKYRSYKRYPQKSYHYNSYNQSYYPRSYTNPYTNISRQGYRNQYQNDGWSSLSQGHSQRALVIFSQQAQSYPGAGLPKAGYALAAAANGDLDGGVRAMRRAFQYDPDSLHELSYQADLRGTIDTLIGRYEYPLQHRGRHRDEAFMVAALSYLKGDYHAAGIAAKRAAKDGDRSRGFRNLNRLLASTN